MFIRLRRRAANVTLDAVACVRTPAGPRQVYVANLGTLHCRRGCPRKLLEMARDRLAGLPVQSADRARLARSLCAALRRLGHVVAHQFEIALAHHAADPRPRLASLQGCTVGPVDHAEAQVMIRRFEWLQTTGRARIWFGLFCPEGNLIGVVGFGHGPHAAGQHAHLVLERGCTLPTAPPNSGSFLIARSLRLLRKLGHRLFRAYSDPAAHETGAIYRALGWRPLPNRHGPWRYQIEIGGKLRSDRATYRRFGSHAAARGAGATLVRVPARVAWAPSYG